MSSWLKRRGRPSSISSAFSSKASISDDMHGMAQYGSVQLTFGGFHWVQYLVPGTFFSTTSAEVPSEL